MDSIYLPREDSELLRRNIFKFAEGFVLDIGTGSGVQAIEAAKHATKVLAVDINPEAIEYCNKHSKHEKIIYRESDLFSNVEGEFDLITFNPPYLPSDPDLIDVALDGGLEGWELIEKFLKEAKNYLKKNGKILLLFSTLSKKEKIESILKKEKYKFQEIDKMKLDFERLFVYEIER